MDFLKLIRAVEDLLFETMVWLILWPKTFVKVVISPGWANSYVDKELQRSDEERFDQFLSPLLFFILSVLPEFALKELTPAGANWARDLLPLPDPSLQTRFSILVLPYVTLPLIFSVIAQLSSGGKLTRTALNPRFQKQAMIAACFQIIGTLTDDVVAPLLSIPSSSGLTVIPAVAWLVYAEQQLLGLELGKPWLATLPRTVCGVILWFSIMVGVFAMPTGFKYLADHRLEKGKSPNAAVEGTLHEKPASRPSP